MAEWRPTAWQDFVFQQQPGAVSDDGTTTGPSPYQKIGDQWNFNGNPIDATAEATKLLQQQGYSQADLQKYIDSQNANSIYAAGAAQQNGSGAPITSLADIAKQGTAPLAPHYDEKTGQLYTYAPDQGNWVWDGAKPLLTLAAIAATAGAAGGALGAGAAGVEGGAAGAGAAGVGAAEGTGLSSVWGSSLPFGSSELGIAGTAGSTAGAGAMDLGDWQDWGSLLDNGTGIDASTGQFAGETANATTGDPSLFSQIKDIYNKVPPGTQQVIKSLLASGDQPGLMSLLGKLGAAGLGAYASNQQAGSLQALADKYAAMGAPSRARFEASMTPGFDVNSIPGYSGAVDTASKNILARLSATGGNPFGNPAGLVQANKDIISGTALPAISEYQRLNLAGGGQANLNAAVPGLETSSIGQTGNVYNSLGYALNAATNPTPSLADTIRALNLQGLQ